MHEVTQILCAIGQGDSQAANQLLPLVYDALRRLAAEKLVHEKPGQSLQATALVHEAYLRLVDAEKAQVWNSRGHFFAAAAEAMRRILIENARRRMMPKHGGGRRRVNLEEAHCILECDDDLLLVNDALERLAVEDSAATEIVKLRLFAGLSVDEAAESLGMSRATAYRHWIFARAWLRSALGEETQAE